MEEGQAVVDCGLAVFGRKKEAEWMLKLGLHIFMD